MNKIALVISILALALGGVSLYLNTKGDSPKKPVSKERSSTDSGASQQFTMAYFEMDSLENNYEYVKDIRQALKQKEENMNRELQSMGTKFRQEMAAWQQKGSAISQEESEQMNRRYQQMNDAYAKKEQELKESLGEESQKKLMDVNKRIGDFLKEYNKTKGYTYIITNEQSLIYYKDSVYDITADVLQGLNDLYKAGKKDAGKKN